MLVLTRRVGERIVIGDTIFCTILGFKGNQISLGFDAPDSVIINREEIYKKIQSEKREVLYCPPMQNQLTIIIKGEAPCHY